MKVYRKECLCMCDGRGNIKEYFIGEELKITNGANEEFIGLLETIGYFEFEIWCVDADVKLQFNYDEVSKIEEY